MKTYDKIIDYVHQFDRRCLQGSRKCFGTGVDIMGIIGILLLLGGVVQIGAGAYFMIVLPIFDSASNIWTGIITGVVGAIYMYYGCMNQSERRQYVNLSLSLIALVTNVANLVIIVVGERGILLSEEDKLLIDRENKNNLYKIAIWGTASTSCTILVILFLVAQFIFCGYLQAGSSKSKDNPVSHFQSQTQERFYPPSRVINSKVPGEINWNNGMQIEPVNGEFGGGSISTTSDLLPIQLNNAHCKGIINDGMLLEATMELHESHNSPKIIQINEQMKFETFKYSRKPQNATVHNSYNNPGFVKVTPEPNSVPKNEILPLNDTNNKLNYNKNNPTAKTNVQRAKRKTISSIKRPTVPPPSPPIPKDNSV